MLVLLAPSFDGSDQSYQALSQATGLVPYDLKSRAKAGSWGLVKAFGDAGQAQELASRMIARGFPAVLVDRTVAHDDERRTVPVQRVELGDAHFSLVLKDRAMQIPYGALACIVEGEVQPGRPPRGLRHTTGPRATSSATLRAVSPALGDEQSLRDVQAAAPVGFLAADLHFATVLWIARIDSRAFDFGAARSGNLAADLPALTNLLAGRSGVRVDRAIKTSSVASFADQPAPMRAHSWPPPSIRKSEAGDPRFDGYSRLIGEAERVARRSG